MKRLHFYKGFEIRNIPQLNRPRFHIYPNLGREATSVAATTSLRSARWLIDVWGESRYCACGAERIPHDYRCLKCAQKGVNNESVLHRQHRRVG